MARQEAPGPRIYPPFAAGASSSLDDSLSSLCNRVEALSSGARTGVRIASADRTVLKRAVFPNIPTTFQSAIREIPMGPPYFGSCTAAMDGGKIITCHDMTKESRFDERFVAICLQHDIRALQSRPIYGPDRKPLGTFVMTFDAPREPTDFDNALMEFAADAARSLLQRELDRAGRIAS